MKKIKPTTGKCHIWTKNLGTAAGHYAAIAKPVAAVLVFLIAIWCVGRIMEALYGNAVFEMSLSYWFGRIVLLLVVLWALASTISSMRDLRQLQSKKAAGISWIFFLILVAVVIFSLQGFRVAAEGLFAALGGSVENANAASFLLIKYHPENPLLAVNLAALKIMGATWDMESWIPYVWGWNFLFAFFIWSCAYGILLMRKRGNLGSKILHLCLAAMGLMALISLKSVSVPTPTQMIWFQAAVPILSVFQLLLAYAFIRTLAISGQKEVQPPETVDFAVPAQKQAKQNWLIGGLPPSAIKMALFVFLVLPVAADLQRHWS